MFNKVMENMEIYYNIQMNIIKNYNVKNINYETLNNIIEINNKNFFNDSDIIINDNIKSKINKLIEVYNQINKQKAENKEIKNINKGKDFPKENKDINNNEIKKNNSCKNNEIIIKYKVDKSSENIRIFGKEFVKNNKGKCIILYESEECELKEEFYIYNKFE